MPSSTLRGNIWERLADGESECERSAEFRTVVLEKLSAIDVRLAVIETHRRRLGACAEAAMSSRC